MKTLNFEECPVPVLQNPWEFSKFIEIYENINPKKVIEIGSFYGGTLFYLLKHAKLNTLVSIDMPVPPSDGRYQDMIDARNKWSGWMENYSEKIDFHNITENSHDVNVVNTVKSIFPENDVDVLFIDGDHSYKGVIEDYENYKALVRPGGIIVFHDMVGLQEVSDAFNEIKRNHKNIQILIDDYNVGWGIGIIYV